MATTLGKFQLTHHQLLRQLILSQVWLAEAEKELGIDISDEAIEQMKVHITMTDEDFVVAAAEEKKVCGECPTHGECPANLSPL